MTDIQRNHGNKACLCLPVCQLQPQQSVDVLVRHRPSSAAMVSQSVRRQPPKLPARALPNHGLPSLFPSLRISTSFDVPLIFGCGEILIMIPSGVECMFASKAWVAVILAGNETYEGQSGEEYNHAVDRRFLN